MISNTEIFIEIANKYNIPTKEDMGGIYLLLDNGYIFSTYEKITGKICVSKDYSYNPYGEAIIGFMYEVSDISKFESKLKESMKLYKAAKENFKLKKMKADFD